MSPLGLLLNFIIFAVITYIVLWILCKVFKIAIAIAILIFVTLALAGLASVVLAFILKLPLIIPL